MKIRFTGQVEIPDGLEIGSIAAIDAIINRIHNDSYGEAVFAAESLKLKCDIIKPRGRPKGWKPTPKS